MDQVVDLSMTLYPARVFPARQSMFSDLVLTCDGEIMLYNVTGVV